MTVIRLSVNHVASGAEGVAVWYWMTRSLDEAAVRTQWNVLSDDERARCDRLLFAEDRRDFTAAHLLLRHALSAYGPISPSEWRFTTSEGGRPSLATSDAGAPKIAFSLSHTKGLVACGITRGTRLGVDVECVRPRPDVMNIARQYFAPPETRSLETMSSSDREKRFVELWTLKESYVKAIGSGLAAQLDKFAFELNERPRLRFCADDDPYKWQFMLAAPTEDTRLAVAIDRDGCDTRRHVSVQSVAPGEYRGETLRILAESEG